MKKRKAMKLAAFLCTASVLASSLSGCAVSSSAEQEEKSSSGSAVSIAATSIAICQILDSLEYDNVIGVPESEREVPERYSDAEKIGAPMTPDIEILKSLNPDLVLSPKTLESSLASQYSSAGIDSAFLNLASVEGMYSAIDSLGEILGKKSEAADLRSDYETYMEEYSIDRSDGPSILLLMAFPDGFFLAATEDSYVGNLVRLAGGKNVYADYEADQEGFININPEDMVQKNPDMILVFAHYNEEAAFAYMEEEFATNEAWSYFDAVNNGKITYLPSSSFGMSATLAWTDALEYLEPVFYGEQ